MAGQTAVILKAYFEADDQPIAAEFAEFIDTLYEKEADVTPKSDNSFSLGSLLKKWKDIYSSGEAFLTKITATGLSTLATVKATVFYNTGLITIASEVNTSIDLSSGNVFKITVDQDIDIRFVDLQVGQFKVVLVQDAVGGRAITFTDVLKVGNVGAVADQIDVLDVVCDGVTVYVNVINDFK